MKTLFLGDVCPTAATNHLFEKKDISTLFTDSLPLFEGNDINFVNIEVALTESDKDIKKIGPALKATPKTAKVLADVGVNCCSLSNNHIFDFGKKGAMDTVAALEEAGIAHTGFGENYEESRKNLVIEKNGEKVCIIAVCEHEYSYSLLDRMGSRGYDEYDTIEDIRRAKEECDCVIVIYHGGKEQCRYPSPRLLKLCRAMARNGADMVLCQHSHCIGCYEEYMGCHILYGQGNFHFVKSVFGGMVPEGWDDFLGVKYDTKTKAIEFVPMCSTEDGVTLAKGEMAEEMLKGFAERNQSLTDGSWIDGWHAFCESMKGLYESVIKNACKEDATEEERQGFGHYLDCEAHTDVWRELFPTWNMTNER